MNNCQELTNMKIAWAQSAYKSDYRHHDIELGDDPNHCPACRRVAEHILSCGCAVSVPVMEMEYA